MVTTSVSHRRLGTLGLGLRDTSDENWMIREAELLGWFEFS